MILMMSVLPKTQTNRDIGIIFHDNLRWRLIKFEPDILKPYDLSSCVDCYDFSNKPMYGVVDTSLVSLYMNNKSTVLANLKCIQHYAVYIENICVSVLSYWVKVVSNIYHILSTYSRRYWIVLAWYNQIQVTLVYQKLKHWIMASGI